MKKRILVCGGRNFTDRDFVFDTLTSLTQFLDPKFCLIHGSARGADMLAHQWAFFQGCPTIEMKANWDAYGKAAGSKRNTWMLDYCTPDLIVAFKGGIGTRNMINQASKRGIDIYEPV